jgi:hypothetical protein
MHLPLGADGELFAASRATSRKHGPPVFGCHAGQKSMLFGALAVIRLKSTFRHLGSKLLKRLNF